MKQPYTVKYNYNGANIIVYIDMRAETSSDWPQTINNSPLKTHWLQCTAVEVSNLFAPFIWTHLYAINAFFDYINYESSIKLRDCCIIYK